MRATSIFTLGVILTTILGSCGMEKGPASLVNVFNGTDVDGNTHPAATVPFGAIQLVLTRTLTGLPATITRIR